MEQMAAAAASALVAAMATDAWAATKAGFARLLGRAGEQQERHAMVRMTNEANMLNEAAADQREQLGEQLVVAWRRRLQDFIEDWPDATQELQALTEQLQAHLQPHQQVWVQRNIARDHGTLFANQGGDQHFHHHKATGGPNDQQEVGSGGQ